MVHDGCVAADRGLVAAPALPGPRRKAAQELQNIGALGRRPESRLFVGAAVDRERFHERTARSVPLFIYGPNRNIGRQAAQVRQECSDIRGISGIHRHTPAGRGY